MRKESWARRVRVLGSRFGSGIRRGTIVTDTIAGSELEAERLANRKAENEREALAGAVKALAARLKHGAAAAKPSAITSPQQQHIKGGPPAWRSVSGEDEMRMLLADALHRTLAAALGPLDDVLHSC